MSSRLRVLFIEDSEPDLAVLLMQFARSEYDVSYTCVETAAEMEEALRNEEWDIIISDYCLPVFTGREALGLVQQLGIDLPFIIVSGNIGEETAVEAMKAGANDYIFKGNLKRLLPAVTRELREAKHRQEYRQTQQALTQVEARYRHVVEHIPAIVYWTDTNHPLAMLYVSPQVTGMFGFEQQALLQGPLSLRHAIHPDERDSVHQAIVHAIQTHQPYNVEYRLRTAEGKYVWVLETADTIPLESDSPMMVQGVLIDITQQKASEVALRRREKQLRTLAIQLSVAEERERRNMAIALHDQISQTLAFAKMEIRALLSEQTSSMRERLERLWAYTDQAYQQTKTLTFELSPPILYDLGFEAALEWLAEQYSTQHRLIIDVNRSGDTIPVEQETAMILFRAVQELLTNVVKHAEAHLVNIQLIYADRAVRLLVTDDGKGYDAAVYCDSAQKPLTFGLFTVRERIEYLGGTFQLTSEKNHGTQVTIELPLVPNEKESKHANDALQNSHR